MFISNNSFEILQHDGGTIGRKKEHLSPPNIFHFGEKVAIWVQFGPNLCKVLSHDWL